MLRELRNQGLCLILLPSLENIINIFSYFFFFLSSAASKDRGRVLGLMG